MNKRLNLKRIFSGLIDFRQAGKVKHLMTDIILTALFTIMSNGQDYEDMVIFGETYGHKLKKYLKYPNGVPSSDTFARVFRMLKPEMLVSILSAYGNCFLDILNEKQICMDGKKLRGANPKSVGNSGTYLLSAWVSENNLCVGQVEVSEKSNEIKAIPQLIEGLNIEGALVSLDAMGCQKDIAELIVEKKGDYLMGLKGNQGTLFSEVEQAFILNEKQTKASTWIEEGTASQRQSRKCSVLDAKEVLLKEDLKGWKNLNTLIMVESKRKDEYVRRYYISSEQCTDKNSPLYFNSCVRGHWSIENQLHWHLDVTFREDESRARKDFSAQNLSIIRKMALHLIQNAKSLYKLSLAKIRYKISLDITSLCEILDFSCG